MPHSPSPSFRAGLVYLYTGLTELLPLHAVYALLMASHGVSTSELSLLFALWTVTTFLFEIPSGAVADRFPRHRVLASAALAQSTGFVLWTALPSLGSFAAGFVLWGLSTALTSGTLQSLLYDGLTADGRSEEYSRVSSRMATVQACSIAVSSVVASPVVLLGGYGAAGWISAALTLLAVPTALAMGRGRRHSPATDTPVTEGTEGAGTEASPAEGWLFLLRAGLAEARDTPQVRSCLLMISVLAGLGVVDEYLPVLAKEGNAPSAVIPLLLLLPWGAMALGSFMGWRLAKAGNRALAGLLLLGGAALALGALSRHPGGFLGIAVFYWALRMLQVVMGARLQHAITGPARATVSSVAGLGAQTVSLTIFLGSALGARWVSASMLVALTSVPVFLTAALLLLRPRHLSTATARSARNDSGGVPPVSVSGPAPQADIHEDRPAPGGESDA
jgi:predicted MFS family arabinose efflux permease